MNSRKGRRIDGEFEAVETTEQFAEHDLQLESSQACPKAEVRAARAEGDVVSSVARDVDPVRIVEHGLVSVRRRIPEHHRVARRNPLARDLDIDQRSPQDCMTGLTNRNSSSIALSRWVSMSDRRSSS